MPTLIGYAIRRSLASRGWNGAPAFPERWPVVVMNAGTRLGERRIRSRPCAWWIRRGGVMDIPATEIPFSYRKAHPRAGS